MRVLWLLLLVPLAAGQTQVFEVSVPEGEQIVAWQDTTTLTATVRVSCDYFLQPPSPTIRVQTSSDAPEAWGSSGEEIVFELGPDCADGEGVLEKTGDITFQPTQDAVALQPHKLTVTASAGTISDDYTRTSDSFVEYVGNHTLIADATPIEWTGGDVEIPITIRVEANGPTRVIFPGLNPAGGRLAGIEPMEFASSGEQSFTMLWTPPDAWETATLRVDHGSHCITQSLYDCSPTTQTTTWSIVNAAPAEEKKSPTIALPLAILVLAWVARR